MFPQTPLQEMRKTSYFPKDPTIHRPAPNGSPSGMWRKADKHWVCECLKGVRKICLGKQMFPKSVEIGVFWRKNLPNVYPPS